MALYTFLMQIHNETQMSASDERKLVIISEIGGAMSMISCVMVFGLFCILPFKNDGLFITGNMCLVVMGAQLSFLGSENTGYPSPIMCKIATCVLHYFFTCLHFASFSYAMHLFSKFGPKVLLVCQRRLVYVITIWLVPAVIVALTLILKGHLYAQGTRCWLPSEDKTRLAYLLPLAVILMVNFSLYCMIIRAGIVHDLTKGVPKRALLKNVGLSSLSSLPILGLLWILGFSVTFDGPMFFKYLYVIFASGQGVLILAFNVIPNSQIQKALCSKIAKRQSKDGEDDTSTSVNKTENSKVDSAEKRKNYEAIEETESSTVAARKEIAKAKEQTVAAKNEPGTGVVKNTANVGVSEAEQNGASGVYKKTDGAILSSKTDKAIDSKDLDGTVVFNKSNGVIVVGSDQINPVSNKENTLTSKDDSDVQNGNVDAVAEKISNAPNKLTEENDDTKDIENAEQKKDASE